MNLIFFKRMLHSATEVFTPFSLPKILHMRCAADFPSRIEENNARSDEIHERRMNRHLQFGMLSLGRLEVDGRCSGDVEMLKLVYLAHKNHFDRYK